MFTIAFTKMKIILKDKAAIAWMLLAPILFITVIVYGFEGTESKCKVSIVDEDGTAYSRQLVTLVKMNEEYPIAEKSMLDAKTDLVKGTSIAIIVIPNGYEKLLRKGDTDFSLKIIKLRDNNRIIAIKNIIANTFHEQQVYWNIGTIAKDKAEEVGVSLTGVDAFTEAIKADYLKRMSEPVIRIENSGQNVEDKSMSDLSSSAIGIMVMFIMFFVVNSAGMLMDERNSGVLNRIHVSMMRRGSILLGQMLGLLFVGWIQILILILVGKYFYQIDWGNSYLGLAILFTCFLFCVSSLGTWISYIANNRTQIIGLIAIIIMPTSLLGGCMWSKDIMSDTLLKIAKFTPQSWVLDGIIGLVTRKNSLESVYRPSFVLCCFAVIFLALTYITSRYGKQR